MPPESGSATVYQHGKREDAFHPRSLASTGAVRASDVALVLEWALLSE
jgi:hypothetical protein